jgi:putative transposase
VVNGEQSCVYVAIDVHIKLVFDVALFKRHGTNPAAVFLHGVTEKHDCSEAVSLIDIFCYRTFSLFDWGSTIGLTTPTET